MSVTNGVTRKHRGSVLATVAGLALLGSSLWAGPAPASTSCANPPAVFPVDQIQKGMVGSGLTVVQGSTPVPFDVKVLGILPDGIAPGIDFILIQVTGPQSFLDKMHGIAAGMSGSPVYINGRLAGAVAYGFFAADHTVGGMTPAQPMVNLFGYPNQTSAPHLARTVVLPAGLRRAFARATDRPLADAPAIAQPLPIPIGVSGLSSPRLAEFQQLLDRRNLPFRVYQAASASAPTSLSPTPH